MPSTPSPVLFVTGAPAAGKKTLVRHLAGIVDAAFVVDTDLFGEYSHPVWDAWANHWLLIASAARDNGLVPILCGYGVHRPSVRRLPAAALLGPSRCLYLDVSEETIHARLSARGGFDDERIARKLRQARELKADADDVVAIDNMPPADVAEHVRAWVRQQISLESA